MNYSVFDIEADGLIENATKIHCLCYAQYKDGVRTNVSTTDYNKMREFFSNEKVVVGHNIVKYDIPMIEKFLGIKYEGRQVDTLGLSWYLYPNKEIHGLEEWGTVFGIEKPKIVDWKNEESKVYIHRCIEDVKINIKLFDMEVEYLKAIYGDLGIDRIIGYLSYKLQCAREQEEVKWKLDKNKCESNLAILLELKAGKVDILKEIMPPHITYKVKAKPKNMFKKDESISKLGQDWLNLLKEKGLPDYHNGALKLIDKTEKGNPGSFPQLKDWAFSLGWIPTTFKYVKEDKKSDDESYTPMNNSTVRKVPQLTSDDSTGLCQSVKDLFEIEPKLEELEDLFIINHRISILKAFLESIDENNMLKAEISGFTNTLRFQHKKPIANLPTIPKKYWEMIRECLIAPDKDHILCGSDMKGLEDNTKHHYMYFYDPDYVSELRTPGFDPHIDIAKLAKHISYEEGEFYKWYDHKKEGKEYEYLEPRKETNRYTNHVLDKELSFGTLINLPEDIQKGIIKTIKPIRLKDKKTNFAAVYGAGGPKIAITANITVKEGYELHSIYWQRNKAVKLIAKNTIHKTVNNQMWLYNPVSQLWYSLRYEKDKFSTLNQSSAVYAFDTWVKACRDQGYKICMQYHDEHVSSILKTDIEKTRVILNNAINKTNEILNLNIKLGISIDFGNTYADIH